MGYPVDGRTGPPVPPDMASTRYPSAVQDPIVGFPVLMDGVNSAKVGGDVLVGRFKGYAIRTLALEERATCPRSCAHWTTCYGNSSPYTKRWRHGKDLEAALRHDVRQRLEERPMLVRLHMLGDFYSWRYLCLWADLLDLYDDLAVFGFTAHKPGTKIGDGIATLRGVYPERFAMRHSDTLGAWGSATLDFPTAKPRIGDGVVCPEQMDANRDNPTGKHCGNCAFCWQSDRTVFFIEHGNSESGRKKKQSDADR